MGTFYREDKKGKEDVRRNGGPTAETRRRRRDGGDTTAETRRRRRDVGDATAETRRQNCKLELEEEIRHRNLEAIV